MGEFEVDWNRLKGDLNNLLWTHLPPETTLKDAESLALGIIAEIKTTVVVSQSKFNK